MIIPLSPIYGKIKNVPNHQPDYIQFKAPGLMNNDPWWEASPCRSARPQLAATLHDTLLIFASRANQKCCLKR